MEKFPYNLKRTVLYSGLSYGVTFEVRLIYLVQICIQKTEIRFSLIFSVGLNSIFSHQLLPWHRSISPVILPLEPVFMYLSMSFTSFSHRNAILEPQFLLSSWLLRLFFCFSHHFLTFSCSIWGRITKLTYRTFWKGSKDRLYPSTQDKMNSAK